MKSALDLANMLPLPRNLSFTLRICCHSHRMCTPPHENATPAVKSALGLAKVMPLNLRKCCACHAIPTWRNLCVAMGPAPNVMRARSETAPTRHRREARTGPRFLRVSILEHFSSLACSFSCHLSERASFQLVAVPRKFLLNFLGLRRRRRAWARGELHEGELERQQL